MKEKGKKITTKQYKHRTKQALSPYKWCKGNHSPPPTSIGAQPVSKQQLFWKSSPSCFIARYDITGNGLSSWSIQTGCPGCVTFQLRPWHCVSTAQQYLNHWCVSNTVLVTNLKHSTIWAARRKLPPVPGRLNTICLTQSSNSCSI